MQRPVDGVFKERDGNGLNKQRLQGHQDQWRWRRASMAKMKEEDEAGRARKRGRQQQRRSVSRLLGEGVDVYEVEV